MTILDLPMDGSPIPVTILLEVKDGSIEEIDFDIICPICKHDKYVVSSDKGFLFCAKCQAMIAKRNTEDCFGTIKWNL